MSKHLKNHNLLVDSSNNILGKILIKYVILKKESETIKDFSGHFYKSLYINQKKLLIVKMKFDMIRQEINMSKPRKLVSQYNNLKSELERLRLNGISNLFDQEIQTNLERRIDYYSDLLNIKKRERIVKEIDYYEQHPEEVWKLMKN